MLQLLGPSGKLPFPNHVIVQTEDLSEMAQKTYSNIEPRKTRLADRRARTHIDVTGIKLITSKIFAVHHESSIITKSNPLESLQINIPISGELLVNIDHKEFSVKPGQAFFFFPNDSIDIRWSDKCCAIIIVIDENSFRQFLNRVYGSHSYHLDVARRILPLDQGAGLSLGNLLSFIALEAENLDSPLNRGISTGGTDELLQGSLGQILTPEQKVASDCRSNLGIPGYVKRAVDYIFANCQSDITITELVDVSDVSLRTLQNAFSKNFGKGPMAFVKQAKLDRVREELLRASHLESNVNDIAMAWGLYHPSNFAKSYFQAFGERPSDTLRRKKT